MKTPLKSLRLIPWPVADRLNLVGFAVWHRDGVEVRHTSFEEQYDVHAGVFTGPGRLEVILGKFEVFFLRTD